MLRIRVLLVDDSLDFLEAAVSVMADWPGIEVIGCATSGREALERVPELRPDVVLVDLHMPDLDGLTTTRSLKRRPNPPAVIIVSLDDRFEIHEGAHRHGADAFVNKSGYYSQVLPTIRRVVQRAERGAQMESHSTPND